MNIFRDYDLSVPYNGDQSTYVAFIEALKMKMSESKLAATLDLPEESIIPPRDLIARYRDRRHLKQNVLR